MTPSPRAAHMVPVAALLLVGCSNQNLGTFNTPPAVSIVRPLDGSSYAPGDIVEIEAVAEDSQDDPQELAVYWTSSIDGDLGEGAPDANGEIYLALSELSAGTHALTLTVVDTDGESASESVSFDIGYGGGGGAPTVILATPTGAEPVVAYTDLTVVGTVTDEQQPWDTLDVTFTSSRDGDLWAGNPASTGTVTFDLAGGLSPGTHVLTLAADDADGNTGVAQLTLEVVDDGRPVVVIDSPADGAELFTTDTISFKGTVADDVTENDALEIAWVSDVDGPLATGHPDSSGFTAVNKQLSEATHTILLEAIDEEAKTGTDTIVIRVVDPLNHDGDGDGYTENEGDCDDDDRTRNPGEVDICDDKDNDCDGMVNDPFWDTYEDNSSSSLAYDLGDVDGTLWSGASLSLSGLTLHGPDDEDWFAWDAHDDFLIDNVEINVRITGLPSSGSYVIELYENDGGLVLRDSDSGSGSLTVSYTGDVFDGGEDDWLIRFYATTWPSRSCETLYEIRVSS
ncbi:MAG: hypothetical protein H6742_06915 [Alphaproteobacteria bacterium]|nr:hypothetical protein [Alphaproteobacteria bacterium]